MNEQWMDCAHESARSDRVFRLFYQTPRAGVELLSDGGGPFGFDIQVALQVDYLTSRYDIDAIFETGCCLGDTTEYLARVYPNIPIWTCDINPAYADFVRTRLARHPNVTVRTGDSASLLRHALAKWARPLVYLDAHWGEQWPLADELRSLRRGIVAVDDFDIGHPRFGYDTYDGVACDVHIVAKAFPGLEALFVGNPFGPYPFPCLQVGRRSGTCYFTVDLSVAPLEESQMFRRVSMQPTPDRIDWGNS